MGIRRPFAPSSDFPMLHVAEADKQIVSVLWGRTNDLANPFVRGDQHGKGIGCRLVERFERNSAKAGVEWIRVAATILAVPFYKKLRYKKPAFVPVTTLMAPT